MPYIKNKDSPFTEVTRLLRGYKLNAEGLAKTLKCSTATAARRLKNPESITLGELLIINRREHISGEKICNALKLKIWKEEDGEINRKNHR